jgi:hypothetical protein
MIFSAANSFLPKLSSRARASPSLSSLALDFSVAHLPIQAKPVSNIANRLNGILNGEEINRISEVHRKRNS